MESLKLTRRKLLQLGGVGVGALALGQLPGAKHLYSAPSEQTIRIAIGLDPDTFDPVKQTTSLVQMMLNHMTESVLYMTPDLQFQPQLATDWSISPDNKAITFKFREGVKFHDGTPMDTDAIKFSLDRLADPEITCPLCGIFYGPLDHVEVIDDLTVKLVYNEPYAPLLMGFAGFPASSIISPTAFEEMGPEGFGRNPVGTGPYRLEEWIPGEKVVMVRNEDYWGEPPVPQRLEWVIAPEGGTRTAMALAGDVDIAYQPPAPDIPRFEVNPSVGVQVIPTTRQMFAAMNVTHPPLDNKKVRQALNYAVDQEAIAERLLLGAGSPNHAPVPSTFFGYHEIGFYEFNPDKAKRLLAEAGFPNGLETTLTFLHPTGRYILDAQVAQAIQSQLATVGVKTELKTMDWPTYVGTLLKPQEESTHDLGILGWGPPPDAHHMLWSMFHSSQHPPASFNISFYSNSSADNLMEQARKEFDEEERSQLYRGAEQIIWDDAPWIFLYTQSLILAMNKRLKGVVTFPWEMFSLVNARKEG